MSIIFISLRHGQSVFMGLCLVWSVSVNAGDQAFFLRELYQMALSHDPSVKAARSVEAAALERLPQAMAQVSPQVVLSAERHSNELTRSGVPLEYNSSNRTLQVRQPLYRAGFQASVNQALRAREEAVALRELAERDLLGRLGAALFEHLLAVQHKEFVDALMASTMLQLHAAERAFKAGAGVRTDIDEAKSRLDSAKVQDLQIRLQIESSRRHLERLTGQSVRKVAALTIEDPWTRVSALPQLAVWLGDTEVLHPQLRALRARIESARNEVAKAEAVGKPTLDAVARITRSQGENVFNPGGNFSNQQIGVQFNWPLYQGGGNDAAVREALAKLEEANHRLSSTRDDLSLRLENQYRSVQEGRLRIEALRQAQRSANQALLSSQRSFEAGGRTRSDVMNAQQNLAQSHRDVTQGRLSYLSAELQLALLAGLDAEQALARIGMWFAPNSQWVSSNTGH